ncbi:vacuolar protein sorting-associated protein 2 homolog 3-like [Silene latifolia]|uniref:vacuolar protein sorting-associated protein 2 homolog 3-like n=1 Tax=Silene latifolia TaxID=37657 RepID=UPI003D785CC4
MNIFKKTPTAKEALRESKREMTNATRGIEKEISSLQVEEKRLVAEIKKTAKTGNEAATKILARQLIRLRKQITNLQGSRAQMRGISTHTQAIHAQSSVASGLKGATTAMATMNKTMAPAKQMEILKKFQRESAQMDMATEMMSDAIDDALDNDEAEEETDDLTNQVLDEIGVDVASQLSTAPKGKIAGKKTEEASTSGIDDLEERLAALRGT